MKLSLGVCELELNGTYLSEGLTDSTAIWEDTEELRRRIQEDGYLFFRGFHNKDRVNAVRRQILSRLQERGKLEPGRPVDEGIAAAGSKDVLFGKADYGKDLPDLLGVVNGPEVMGFFDRFLGGPSLTLDYKWPRAVAPGSGTGAHYDFVYMGRGTRQLYTMWTPLGDVPMEMGSLCICIGSHRFERLRETYGNLDVSRDKVKGSGWFSENPVEIVDKFGGHWATIDFQAGDAVFFGMHTLHMSTMNRTKMYRTSCDTRYQLRSEPVDARFMGKNPTPPGYDNVERTTDMKQLRDGWKL